MGKRDKSSAKDPSEALATAPRGKRRTKAEREDARRARTEQPAKPGMPGSVNDSRRCTATANRTGERCKAPAIKGHQVCRVHGGASPQVIKTAKERLLELVDPALAALHAILSDETTDDPVKVRAALGILDRTGYGPGATLTVQTTTWDEMFADAVDIDRSGLDATPEPGALPGGGGQDPLGMEDYQQAASDAQAEAWREYDVEDARDFERGRIRPDENTVRGEVVDILPPPPHGFEPGELGGEPLPNRPPTYGPTLRGR